MCAKARRCVRAGDVHAVWLPAVGKAGLVVLRVLDYGDRLAELQGV
jgi:hypothetical protein